MIYGFTVLGACVNISKIFIYNNYKIKYEMVQTTSTNKHENILIIPMSIFIYHHAEYMQMKKYLLKKHIFIHSNLKNS